MFLTTILIILDSRNLFGNLSILGIPVYYIFMIVVFAMELYLFVVFRRLILKKTKGHEAKQPEKSVS